MEKFSTTVGFVSLWRLVNASLGIFVGCIHGLPRSFSVLALLIVGIAMLECPCLLYMNAKAFVLQSLPIQLRLVSIARSLLQSNGNYNGSNATNSNQCGGKPLELCHSYVVRDQGGIVALAGKQLRRASGAGLLAQQKYHAEVTTIRMNYGLTLLLFRA